MFGYTTVKACISNQDGDDYSYCEWKGTIPREWTLAFWGEDNCMYSDGRNRECSHRVPLGSERQLKLTLLDLAIELGCAGSTGAVNVGPIYG